MLLTIQLTEINLIGLISMSDPFRKYIDEKHDLIKSYYDHHKLHPRTAKTKDIMRPKISSNPSSHEISRNTFRMTKKYPDNLEDIRKTSPKSKNTNIPQKLTIGRNLFEKQIRTKPHLGPGDYDPPFRRSNSFGYIQKDSLQKSIPSQKIKDRINQYLGPGRYAMEESQNFLSKHRSLTGNTFGSENLIRCILSKQKSQNINLKLTEENNKRQVWKQKIGPGFYNIQKSESKIDKFTRTFTLPVSVTERSSLIKKQKLPGPGYYEWQTNFVQKLTQKNRKPKIQFKFVH